MRARHTGAYKTAQSDVQNSVGLSANEKNGGSVGDIKAYRSARGTIPLVIITTPIRKHTQDKHRNKDEIEGGNKQVNNSRRQDNAP